MSIQSLLAIWGASLSTILAVVNLYTLYSGRTKLSTSYYFDSLEGSADKIVIYNIGKLDIIVDDYKLFFSRWRIITNRDYLPDNRDLDIFSLRIMANNQSVLTFPEPDRINLTNMGNRNLYLELGIAGNRSKKILKVY